jgi:hypothetical protein
MTKIPLLFNNRNDTEGSNENLSGLLPDRKALLLVLDDLPMPIPVYEKARNSRSVIGKAFRQLSVLKLLYSVPSYIVPTGTFSHEMKLILFFIMDS